MYNLVTYYLVLFELFEQLYHSPGLHPGVGHTSVSRLGGLGGATEATLREARKILGVCINDSHSNRR